VTILYGYIFSCPFIKIIVKVLFDFLCSHDIISSWLWLSKRLMEIFVTFWCVVRSK